MREMCVWKKRDQTLKGNNKCTAHLKSFHSYQYDCRFVHYWRSFFMELTLWFFTWKESICCSLSRRRCISFCHFAWLSDVYSFISHSVIANYAPSIGMLIMLHVGLSLSLSLTLTLTDSLPYSFTSKTMMMMVRIKKGNQAHIESK